MTSFSIPKTGRKVTINLERKSRAGLSGFELLPRLMVGNWIPRQGFYHFKSAWFSWSFDVWIQTIKNPVADDGGSGAGSVTRVFTELN